MKKMVLSMVVVVVVVSVTTMIAFAGASAQPFTGSLTYQNPNADAATGFVKFYSQNSGTEVATQQINIPAHGAGSFSFGGITALGTTFAGSAVLSADKYIATTVIEYSTTPGLDRAVYTGSSADDASDVMYIPLISQNAFDQLTTVSVQNADVGPVNISVKYVNRNTGNIDLTVPINGLPAGSAKYLKSDTIGLPAGFSGSAVITATGKIVASANNPYVNANKIVSFEGVGVGSNKVSLPSVQCNYGGLLQTTYFAIQNTSLSASTAVTVTYYNTAGTQTGQRANVAITPGKKFNTDPCTDSQGNGFLGSGIVTASGPGIVVLVNTGASNSQNFATAYDGIGQGFQRGALSYIRWGNAATDWRTYIACQNVGGSPTNVTLTYYNFAGVPQGTPQVFNSVAANIKFNSNPSAAGALDGSSKFSGAVEISAASGGLVGCVVQATSVDGLNAAAFNAVRVP
jgi:hypothetical protein